MASRSTRGARGGSGEIEFDIRSNLRQVLADLKEFDPKLATEVRRQLRASGDAAIKAMGDILSEESGGTVTGKTHVMGTDSKGRSHLRVHQIQTKAANNARSRGSRLKVKAGLKLRVTTGKTRTSIRLATTTGDLRKALNTRSWRHPVFGNREASYVEQPGNQYFNRGAWSEAKNLRNALDDAIQIALDAIATHNTTLE